MYHTINCCIVKAIVKHENTNINGEQSSHQYWMTGYLKTWLDTSNEGIWMDALVILCESLLIDLFFIGNQVYCWNQVPGSHFELESEAAQAETVHHETFVQGGLLIVLYKVSVTMYIVISYLLVCLFCCEFPVPFLPALPQPLWMRKLDLRPIRKTWLKINLLYLVGSNCKIMYLQMFSMI